MGKSGIFPIQKPNAGKIQPIISSSSFAPKHANSKSCADDTSYMILATRSAAFAWHFYYNAANVAHVSALVVLLHALVLQCIDIPCQTEPPFPIRCMTM